MGTKRPMFNTEINLSTIIGVLVLLVAMVKFEMGQSSDMTANKVQIQNNKEVIAKITQTQSDVVKTLGQVRLLLDDHLRKHPL